MTAQLISFNTPQPKPVKEPECSFCGTPKSRCKVLINSQSDLGKYICGNCVKQATRRMASAEEVV